MAKRKTKDDIIFDLDLEVKRKDGDICRLIDLVAELTDSPRDRLREILSDDFLMDHGYGYLVSGDYQG